jgi:hypothetical protein
LQYRPNPFFLGRDRVLNDVHEMLFTRPTTALTQGPVGAVTALGGVGKTAVARHYAEKFWRCYPQMFWVDCLAKACCKTGGSTPELTRSGHLAGW